MRAREKQIPEGRSLHRLCPFSCPKADSKDSLFLRGDRPHTTGVTPRIESAPFVAGAIYQKVILGNSAPGPITASLRSRSCDGSLDLCASLPPMPAKWPLKLMLRGVCGLPAEN